ncbi:hypothetical protein R5R35_005858 [Gryllus longicercus]|uniref:Mitochondrial fission process protein 1 n=1 Tax=Gryllus longicercus TaxID=2509291 RepID=A0AAN9V6K4_9ORTH
MGDNGVDLFRDTPVRLLGYANEVGEAFRSLVHVNWVRLTYGISSAYVLADTYDKASKASAVPYKTEANRNTAVMSVAADTLIWQAFASVIVPGYTINRVCACSNYALARMTKMPSITRKWITTAIGLSCIPIIFRPIDHMVDYIMDNSVRIILPAPQSRED